MKMYYEVLNLSLIFFHDDVGIPSWWKFVLLVSWTYYKISSQCHQDFIRKCLCLTIPSVSSWRLYSCHVEIPYTNFIVNSSWQNLMNFCNSKGILMHWGININRTLCSFGEASKQIKFNLHLTLEGSCFLVVCLLMWF